MQHQQSKSFLAISADEATRQRIEQTLAGPGGQQVQGNWQGNQYIVPLPQDMQTLLESVTQLTQMSQRNQPNDVRIQTPGGDFVLEQGQSSGRSGGKPSGSTSGYASQSSSQSYGAGSHQAAGSQHSGQHDVNTDVTKPSGSHRPTHAD